MSKFSYEKLNALEILVQDRLGEGILRPNTAETIVRKLHLKMTSDKFRKQLKTYGIPLKELQFDPASYGLSENYQIYTHSKVWSFIKELEQQGKVTLDGIASMDDIFKRNYHQSPTEKRDYDKNEHT